MNFAMLICKFFEMYF